MRQKTFIQYYTILLNRKEQPTRNIMDPQPNTYNKDGVPYDIMFLFKGLRTERSLCFQYHLSYWIIFKVIFK